MQNFEGVVFFIHFLFYLHTFSFLGKKKTCAKRKKYQKQKINYGHRLTQINTDDKNQRG
jgi:hypothetical protein